ISKEKYHPYHLILRQELHRSDYQNRVRFCQWFLHQMHNMIYFGVIVWCGILGNQLIGPYFINERLTGRQYSNCLRDILPSLLENLPVNIRTNIWYTDNSPIDGSVVVENFCGHHVHQILHP
ncbi:hypothetical protein WN55_06873, partial [Dufourea novaeangliae]